ncbi:MAG TPA: hypothetical protein IAA52_13515 [Candidatus Pullichristensenella stercorigallinarum]|uniref:Uncharacterized protein n=1 Tax=Candidatus Pullichristensenella stercorigallinarum TaxID=2840909 RepID=A0A9D0ZPC9_9FIRM|nr:hypothetical protein [Candidatus Pullichristensenella stercorigallinarum]
MQVRQSDGKQTAFCFIFVNLRKIEGFFARMWYIFSVQGVDVLGKGQRRDLIKLLQNVEIPAGIAAPNGECKERNRTLWGAGRIEKENRMVAGSAHGGQIFRRMAGRVAFSRQH